MNTVYKIFYDYNSIKLDTDGEIRNENNCVYIAEYEWDDDTETAGKFIRRMNGLNRHWNEEFPMDITVEQMEDMESIDEYMESVRDAWDALYAYLEEYMVWRTIYGGYYNPDEYVCEGLEDRDEIYYRISAWKAVQEKKAQGA